MSARIVLTTFGSLGDLHPYLALGLELKKRGHDVVVATSATYGAKIEATGLGFRPVRPDMPDQEREIELMARLMDEHTGPQVALKELLFPKVREAFLDTRQAAVGADLIVGHPLTFGARLVSELDHVRWVSSVLAPMSFFSVHDAPVIPGSAVSKLPRPIGPWLFGALMKLARWNLASWSEPLRALRRELGLPPAPDALFEGQHSDELTLGLFSPVLGRPQPDWPASARLTGFCFHDADGSEGLPPELARFLDAGPPPLVFTLGSSAVWSAGSFYAEAAEAARRLGQRAVLLTGRAERNRPRALPPGVECFDYAPYSQLFARAAAVVHQGGVGTTAQALASGRPMLVVPFGFDQPDNGARVARLGVGRVLGRRRFTAKHVTRALGSLLADEGIRARATKVGEQVRAEDGPRVAADAIEGVLARR